MDSRPPSPGAPYAGLTVIWSPALDRIAREVSRDRTVCWLVISLAAMAVIPVGGAISPFASMFPLSSFSPTTYSSSFDPMEIWFTIISQLVGYGIAVVFVAGVVFWAVRVYKQQIDTTLRDLVYGHAALTLIDEQYGLAVEASKNKHFRLNPKPVQLGTSFPDRLHHFALYYKQYLRLAYSPAEIQIPNVVDTNCWGDGFLLGVAACLSCGCIGFPLLILVVIRIVLIYPRILAIKQAVLNYLSGFYDQELEQQYQAAHGAG